jgi:hypothetical protein
MSAQEIPLNISCAKSIVVRVAKRRKLCDIYLLGLEKRNPLESIQCEPVWLAPTVSAS